MAKRFGYECPEFRGEELKFGNRAKSVNIPKTLAKDFWSGRNVIFTLEADTIKRYIEKDVEAFLRENREREILQGEIDNRWNDIKEQISQYYHGKGSEDYLTPKKEEFVKKTLHKSYSLGTAFNVLLWLSIFLEIIIVVAQTIATSFSVEGYIDTPSIVVAIFMGILLAVGGWLVGIFLSIKWFDNELNKHHLGEHTHLGQPHYFFLGIGLALILFVALSRTFAGGGVYAFTVSIILGFLVAIMKAFKDYYEGMRCFIGNLRLLYFERESSKSHEDHMKEYEQFYKDTFSRIANRYNVKIRNS